MTRHSHAQAAANEAHQDINGYGASYDVACPEAASNEALFKFSSDLLSAISAKCEQMGAKDISHVKLGIHTDSGFVHASVVGKPENITVTGGVRSPAGGFSLTVNAVIFGMGKEDVMRATEDSLEAVLESHGFRRGQGAGREV